MCIYVYICVCMCMYIYICMCIYIYVCVCIVYFVQHMYNDICLNLLTSDYMCLYLQWGLSGLSSGIFECV